MCDAASQIGDGKSSAAFHTAVNGEGRTFSVINVVSGPSLPHTEVIGGYNPVSWNSSGGYTGNPTDVGRTAFLFNLTQGLLQRQNLSSQGQSQGYSQTLNSGSYGPTFGGGYDLGVNGNLDSGYVYNFSYGGTTNVTNILGNPNGSNYSNTLGYNGIEVFTITSEVAATPEPGTITLFVGMGLSGSVFVKRRRRQGSKEVTAQGTAGN